MTPGRSEEGQTLAWLLLAAVLFSAVGLIGRITPLTPGGISFGRSIAAAAALGYLVWRNRDARQLSKLGKGKMTIAGICQALNWSLFFASIQTGGMAVAVLSLFTYPILTAIAEPIVFKQKAKGVEIVGALLVLAGVFFVTPDASLANQTTLGVVLGVASAFFLTIRNLLGRSLVEEVSAVTLNFWMCLLCIPIFSVFRLQDPHVFDWVEVVQVVSLGVLFTAVPQVIFFDSLKRVSAASASLVVSAQPIFSIGFAALVFGDIPTGRTLIGGSLIVAAVLLVSLWGVRGSKEPEQPSP